MKSNRSWKGFSIYQLITILLNFCVVQAQYITFVNDPVQRKLCQVKTSESVCVQDSKCAWNPDQWLCNEFGYQPDIQHCNAAACPGQDCLRASLVHCVPLDILAVKSVRTVNFLLIIIWSCYTILISTLIPLQWTADSPISAPVPKLVIKGLRPERALILSLRMAAKIVLALLSDLASWKPVQVRIICVQVQCFLTPN